MLRKFLAGALALCMVTSFGCYDTYNVKLDELAKAQEGGSAGAVKVTTDEGEEVVITSNTKIGVTENAGDYHSISPFNFTIAGSQLVAPDEDLLLPASAIATGNVKLVSGTKTAILVTAGVAALLGAGLAIALTAEDRKEFGE